MKLSIELTHGFTNVLNVYRHRIVTESASSVFESLRTHFWLDDMGIKPLLVPSSYTRYYSDFKFFYNDNTSLYYLYIGTDGVNSLIFTFPSFDKFLGH